MAELFHVIARGELSVPIPVVSRTLAQATGRVAFDVTREIRERVGILASELTDAQANRAVVALLQAGVKTFALPESGLVRFPDPAFLETARLGESALEVADLRDADHRRIGAVNVAYKDIVLLATAQVRTETRKRVVESEPHLHSIPPLAGTGVFAAAVPAPDAGERTVRYERQTRYDHYLDLLAVEPAHHLRLPAGSFNFVRTGLKMQPTSLANLCQFIKALGPRCTQAYIDPSVLHVMDGSPHTNLRLNSVEQYDAYLLWRTQLLYHPEG